MGRTNETTKIRQNSVLLESLKHNYAIWHFIRYQRIADFVNEINGRDILDVGCGIGLVDFLLANKTVIGIDVNAENIREARRIERTMKPIENTVYIFLVADLHCLPFRKKKRFDVIILSEVLEHIKHDKKVVYDMLSLLRKSGFLVITIPNELRLTLSALFGLKKAKYMHPDHLREYKVSDACGSLTDSASTVYSINGIYVDFPLFNIFNGLFHVLKRLHRFIVFRYLIYSVLYKLYVALWMAVEKLLWNHSFYILLVFKRPSTARASLMIEATE